MCIPLYIHQGTADVACAVAVLAHCLQSAAHHRCELLPVRLDAGGVDPTHLDALLTARQAAGQPLPRVLYTIPTGQNPTGSVMSHERMQEVYNVTRKWDLLIIEDDAYYWLQYPSGIDDVPGLNLRRECSRCLRIQVVSDLL
eukprot:GHRR01027328.1.p1 GENE.GHRR01027328.1~~GHRR01027328.1.p1  ORF type:complete len:142 (-),score=25.82 GHRR01027328.1:83-508(-)